MILARRFSWLLSVFHTEAGRGVQDRCLKLVDHPDPVARRGVALILGNIAAVHRNELDRMKCQPALEKLTCDTEEEVRTAGLDSGDYVLHAIELRGVS